MMVLGVIIGATSYRPPLPLCRVGKGLHVISTWFKVGLGWFVSAYSSYSIHKAKEVGPQSTKGYGYKWGQYPGCNVTILH